MNFSRPRFGVFPLSGPKDKGVGPRAGVVLPLLIFLPALLIRLAYILEIRNNPTFYNLILDCLSYDQWARTIAAGSLLRGEVFYQDPLYPYFLALLYKVFGHHLLFIRMIQAVVGSATCVLIYLLGREVFDRKVALLAGLFSAGYGGFLFYDGMINKPVLGVFLTALTLLVFVAGVRKKDGRFLFAAGLSLGLAILVRANLICSLPLFLVWLAVSPRKKALSNSLLLFAGVALSLGPATVHNYLVSGEFVLTTAQAGENFYIGNHPENETGTYLPPVFLRSSPKFEELDFKARAEFLSGKKLSSQDVSSFWLKETLELIESNPSRFIANLLYKAGLFINKYEIPDNHSYGFFKTYYSKILDWDPLDFRSMGSLGLAGLILLLFLKSGDGPARLFPLFFLVYLGSIIPFYIFARYRIPVMPVLILSSAFFIVHAVRCASCGAWGRLAGAILILGLSCVLVNLDLKKEDFSPQFGNLGYSFLEKGDLKKALKYYEKAARLGPGYAEPRYFIGRVYAEMGDWKKAAANFQKAIHLEPRLFSGHSGLGIALARQGDLAGAERSLTKAVQLRPYAPEAHNNLGMLYAIQGDVPSAEKEFQKALALDPGFGLASRNLSRLEKK